MARDLSHGGVQGSDPHPRPLDGRPYPPPWPRWISSIGALKVVTPALEAPRRLQPEAVLLGRLDHRLAEGVVVEAVVARPR